MARKPTVHHVAGWATAGTGRSGSVEGLVAPDGHPVAVPPLRIVVPHGVVLDAAVVPEGDGTLLPAEATLELRRLHVAEARRRSARLSCTMRVVKPLFTKNMLPEHGVQREGQRRLRWCCDR